MNGPPASNLFGVIEEMLAEGESEQIIVSQDSFLKKVQQKADKKI
jgi:hypothetical protein